MRKRMRVMKALRGIRIKSGNGKPLTKREKNMWARYMLPKENEK